MPPMRDPLIPLCQIIAEKLREHPQADPTALVAFLREAMAAAPDVVAAIQTDPRVVQINQGDATAFQTWVAGGGVANIGVHLHEVDAITLTTVLERFLRGQPSSTIPQNLPRSGAVAFVGRAQELARLHQQLNQSGRLAITVIVGMGGIGKTELA